MPYPTRAGASICSPGDNTGHHLVEDHWIRPAGDLMPDFGFLAAKKGARYTKPGGPYQGAPTMCANRSRYEGKHGIAHGTGGILEETFLGKPFSYAEGKAIALRAHKDANPASSCSEACTGGQLDDFYGDDGSKQMHTPTKKQPMTKQQRQDAERRTYDDQM